MKSDPPCTFPSITLLLHHLSKMQLDVDESTPAIIIPIEFTLELQFAILGGGHIPLATPLLGVM